MEKVNAWLDQYERDHIDVFRDSEIEADLLDDVTEISLWEFVNLEDGAALLI